MNQPNSFARRFASSLLVLLFIAAASVSAQTTAFTYQGRLTDQSAAANGVYDLGFALFDSAVGGAQIDAAQTRAAVSVANGTFTVQLDFGAAAFPGANRFLEIAVKKSSDANFTTLTPRQQITGAPYATRAAAANTADALTTACSGCVGDDNIASLAGGKITGAVAEATNAVTANSANVAATASAVQTSAGGSVVAAINDEATTATINSNRLSADVVRLNPLTAQESAGGASDDAILNLRGRYTIGSENIQSNFRLHNDGGFFVAGQNDNFANSGGVPIEGAGTRMMWHPRKAAFRAGGVTGTQWDEANIGHFSTAFGRASRASGDYGFAAGLSTVAANISSVAIGEGSVASGAASVALGYGAHTNARQGTFVFADRSVPLDYNADGTVDPSTLSYFKAAVNHSAYWRVSNGFRIFTSSNLSTGVTIQSGAAASNWCNGQTNAVISTSTCAYLSAGGVWTNASSRDLKTNFAPVKPRAVLQKVLNLPIQTWNYKAENQNIRHIGAMSQDFAGAFKLGGDDRGIATVDADGVAFAAIQGLNEEVKTSNARLQAENRALRTALNSLEARLKRLERAAPAKLLVVKRRK